MYNMKTTTYEAPSQPFFSAVKSEKTILLFGDVSNQECLFVKLLQNEGYRVHRASQPELGQRIVEQYRPDMLLFDVANTPMELIGQCHSLRQNFTGPILILSETANEMTQILAMEMGIDDLLIRTVNNSFILAKIRALLRRSHELKNHNSQKIQLGDLVIDAERREVLARDEVVDLTTREFDVLWCLAQNTRKVLSRDDIHRQIYNSEYNGFDRSIDIYISRIRQKIGDDPTHPRYLKTVRGTGYLLADERPA